MTHRTAKKLSQWGVTLRSHKGLLTHGPRAAISRGVYAPSPHAAKKKKKKGKHKPIKPVGTGNDPLSGID